MTLINPVVLEQIYISVFTGWEPVRFRNNMTDENKKIDSKYHYAIYAKQKPTQDVNI